MSSKSKQIFLMGLIMTVIGTILTIFNWYLALYTGRFYFQAAFIGPVAITIGIGATICPYKMIPITFGNSLRPTRFTKVILIVGIINGLINFTLLLLGKFPFAK
jgi:hypothetical protein